MIFVLSFSPEKRQEAWNRDENSRSKAHCRQLSTPGCLVTDTTRGTAGQRRELFDSDECATITKIAYI
jgi:hypothetical protein